jgi:hypothetical protein
MRGIQYAAAFRFRQSLSCHLSPFPWAEADRHDDDGGDAALPMPQPREAWAAGDKCNEARCGVMRPAARSPGLLVRFAPLASGKNKAAAQKPAFRVTEELVTLAWCVGWRSDLLIEQIQATPACAK